MSSVENETGRNGGKGGKGLVIGVTIGVIIILVLIGVIVYLVISQKETSQSEGARSVSEETIEKRDVVVTADNAEDIVAEMAQQEYIEPGYYETSMTTEWHFPDGKSASSDAYVANVANNTNDIYFDVVLADDENQVIYASPVIPRGGELDQITLDTPLEAGSYDCVLIYHLVDEEQNTISTLRVGVTIQIEK